jgi:CRISPR-associated protein (TIGR02710 family)
LQKGEVIMDAEGQLRGRVLLMTVGTGDGNNREESLYRPLRLSVAQGQFARVVLLPSRVTAEWADVVQRDLSPLQVQVSPLPQKGDEDNADHCFDHFSAVLTGLQRQGWSGHHMEIDPTRGTKMMSAALVLAAVRHNVSALRYVSGDRDAKGAVLPGTERISAFRTTRITAARRMSDAEGLFRHGNFAAVLDLLPDPDATLGSPVEDVPDWPEEWGQTLRWTRCLARFHAAWDRLDYREAARVLREESPDWETVTRDAAGNTALWLASWQPFIPGPEVRDWVMHLAEPFPDGDAVEVRQQQKAPYLLRLAVDVWANGLRRIRAGQLEDAAVRGYRVLEMIGQMRLFLQGHDSARLDPEHPDVMAYVIHSDKEGNKPFTRTHKGKLEAARERVAGLLKFLHDPMGKKLTSFGANNSKTTAVTPDVRNNSVLIHGFQAQAQADGTMEQYYRQLEQDLLLPCLTAVAWGDARWLELARFPERFA